VLAVEWSFVVRSPCFFPVHVVKSGSWDITRAAHIHGLLDRSSGSPASSLDRFFFFVDNLCSMVVCICLRQWLEDRHPTLQAISFVDDIGLVVECSELGEGAR
jgi:hypothetical protein